MTESAADTVLVMAGGTGGHVFPGLAVAEVLRARGTQVVWMGTRRGLEADAVPAAGIPMGTVHVGGLRGKGWGRRLTAPFVVGLALVQAAAFILRWRPRAVLGMGGFAAGPGGVAAWLLRRPLVIHEQNAIAGLTNRWLARLATRVLEGFPGAFPPATGAVHTGNPVRGAISTLPAPGERYAEHRGACRVLVLGGSQGALALNEVLPRAVGRLAPERRPVIRHQAGPRTLETARTAYAEAGVEATLSPFIDDMAEAYAWADLVVSRAGASTVAELAAAGVAALLVPYPYAVDDHQTANARFLADGGAAVVVAAADCTPEIVAAHLEQLCGDRRRLAEMALAARALGRPDAADRVARLCLEAAHV